MAIGARSTSVFAFRELRAVGALATGDAEAKRQRVQAPEPYVSRIDHGGMRTFDWLNCVLTAAQKCFWQSFP
jgi:hypothetical protein